MSGKWLVLSKSFGVRRAFYTDHYCTFVTCNLLWLSKLLILTAQFDSLSVQDGTQPFRACR